MIRNTRWLVAGVVLLTCGTTWAYRGSVHQELTFMAAKQLNRCLTAEEVQPLGPLEVRYVVRRNVSESDRNVLRRMFQWRYYDRRQKERSLLGVVETRMHEHYNESVEALHASQTLAERYTTLGVIVHYLQQVTVPAFVIPIFYPRVWRLTGSDQFDEHPLNAAALEPLLDGLCSRLLQHPATDFQSLLVVTAEATRTATKQPIPGIPAKWTEFWEDDADPSDFGEYGSAGNNFGRDATFRCGPDRRERCHLVDDDPIYQEFANQRHLDAILATMRAMYLVQRYPASESQPDS